MNNADTFHQTRIPFAIINHKLVYTMFDKRSHKEWLKQVYGVSEEEYENIIRGYMKDGQVFFYKTSNFEPVDMQQLGIDSLKHIQIISMVYMNKYNPKCFNGMHIGESGTQWEPIDLIGSIQEIIDQKVRCLSVVSNM